MFPSTEIFSKKAKDIYDLQRNRVYTTRVSDNNIIIVVEYFLSFFL